MSYGYSNSSKIYKINVVEYNYVKSSKYHPKLNDFVNIQLNDLVNIQPNLIILLDFACSFMSQLAYYLHNQLLII